MTATPDNFDRAATVDEVLAFIAVQVRPLDAEALPLAEAHGRVLREAVRAREDQPPFDRSAVDGYALRLDDSSTRFRIVESIRAGDWKPRQLEHGQAVQIATGGALPGEGLQVVMKEDARRDGTEIVLLRRDAARNIRFRGEDTKAGSVLASEGTILSPGASALLASIGHVQPWVTRQPRVLHVATGSEIVPPDHTPQRGQIRDSNSTLVRAFLRQWGIEPGHLRVAEDETAILDTLRGPFLAVPTPDLLLISGGASVGEHDFTPAVLEELGFTLHVRRTATRPGKPLIFATRGPVVAFGLPGNPLAHFVCLNLYVRSALERLRGRPATPAFSFGALAQEYRAEPSSRETLCPARLQLANPGVELTPLLWRSSGDLTSLASANALVRIPPGCGTLPHDTQVEFTVTTPVT